MRIEENSVCVRVCLYGCVLWLCCRCREKQRKESTRLVSVNAKLTALNRLLMEENERLARHTSQLTLDNHMLRQQLNELPGGPAPPPGSRRHLPNNQVNSCS
jgi:homeobox-leucine zipper protein